MCVGTLSVHSIEPASGLYGCRSGGNATCPVFAFPARTHPSRLGKGGPTEEAAPAWRLRLDAC